MELRVVREATPLRTRAESLGNPAQSGPAPCLARGIPGRTRRSGESHECGVGRRVCGDRALSSSRCHC